MHTKTQWSVDKQARKGTIDTLRPRIYLPTIFPRAALLRLIPRTNWILRLLSAPTDTRRPFFAPCSLSLSPPLYLFLSLAFSLLSLPVVYLSVWQMPHETTSWEIGEEEKKHECRQTQTSKRSRSEGSETVMDSRRHHHHYHHLWSAWRGRWGRWSSLTEGSTNFTTFEWPWASEWQMWNSTE